MLFVLNTNIIKKNKQTKQNKTKQKTKQKQINKQNKNKTNKKHIQKTQPKSISNQSKTKQINKQKIYCEMTKEVPLIKDTVNVICAKPQLKDKNIKTMHT